MESPGLLTIFDFDNRFRIVGDTFFMRIIYCEEEEEEVNEC